MIGVAYLGSGWLGRYGDGSEAFVYAPTSNTKLFVNVAGSTAAIARDNPGDLKITLALNQGSATFSVRDSQPAPFSLVVFGLGSFLQSELLFRGRVQESVTTHEEIKTNLRWDAVAIDSSAEFDRNLVFATYINVSATAVAQDILSKFCPDFTGNHIAVGLELITVSFQGETSSNAFAIIANQIGGYWYRDTAYDTHLFITETPDFTPDALDINNTTLQTDPPLTWSSNVAQHRNRVIGIGASTTLSAPIAPGQSSVPLRDTSMFGAIGTVLIGTQRINYTSIHPGNVGALIGPGVTPSSPLTGSPASGAGVDAGAHQYAYTWVTAGGQTLPSPIATVTTGTIPSPSVAPGGYSDTSVWTSRYTVGDTLQYGISYSSSPTPGSGVVESALITGPIFTVPLWSGAGSHGAVQHVTFNIVTDPSGIAKYFHVYVSKNGSSFLLLTWGNLSSSGAVDITDAFGFVTTAYPGATPAAQQVSYSGVAVGPAGVTSRKIYRTIAGGAQLKLVATIADNTTTTGTDSTADASLGANAPGSDTSGLTSTSGTVSPGATTIQTAGPSGFPAAGWVVANGILIHYASIVGNTLSGIPSSGDGSITAALNFGSTVVVAPQLLGVPASGAGAITAAVLSNTPVSLYTQRDNLGAQATIAAIEGGTSTGVYSTKVVDTNQFSQASLDARCDADLALFSDVRGILTIAYRCTDRKSRPGRPVHVNLLEAGLLGDFVIQQVTISNIDAADGTQPWFDCVASSVRFSLEDLLRHVFVSQ